MRDLTDNDLWSLLEDDVSLDELEIRRQHSGERPARKPAAPQPELAEELFQEEAGYNFTYHAARHEQGWISGALESFYADSLIQDVLAIVRKGKEATVYCCQAHPNIGLPLLAAKIYRPRMLRNLKNDAMYREGRTVLDDHGKAVHDARAARAMAKKTHKGKEMIIASWIEHEYQTMRALHAAGADIPAPVGQEDNAILMEYIGELNAPAPALSNVTLEPAEARRLFERLLHNVELMLAGNRIHADLSAYNVLYWEGDVRIIDFPQVVDPLYNPYGADLLLRDVERLCQYFNRYGIRSQPRAIADDLWNRYLRGRLGPE